MLLPGLVSVSFRSLPPREIVSLVRQGGLAGIEWGGDVHVPHGDLCGAREVRARTEEAGLAVAAYGSYYRIGRSEHDGLSFARVLETALALGAPLVRVWAGQRGSREADEAYRRLAVAESGRIADLAADAGVLVAYEFHGGTLTDTAASARRLLEEAAHPHLRTLWQPPAGGDVPSRQAGLREILPWLANVHAFHWQDRVRRPLAEGSEAWREYLDTIAPTGHDRFVLLEFVQDDAPEAFLRDAGTLRAWLRSDRRIGATPESRDRAG